MAIRVMLCVFSVCLITACGSGAGSNKSVASVSSSSFSVSSSIQMGSSSSNAVVIRQKVDPSEADFFQKAGLWVTFTKINSRNRRPQNDIQKPFLEERLQQTSVNTFVFAPQSEGLTVGDCVRTLEPEQVKGGFRLMLQSHIGDELYCATEDNLYHEIDGSYTVEYLCDKKLVGTTRMIKTSSSPEFKSLGLTLSSAQIQQPVCMNWNISEFEVWSLDADGNDIEMEVNAPMANIIQLRVGLDDDSVVLHFTNNNQGAWHVGAYDLNSQLTTGITANVSVADAGIISPSPAKYFFAQQGDLQIDLIEPLKLSGSFEMHGANNASLSGSFSFDVSEYFSN